MEPRRDEDKLRNRSANGNILCDVHFFERRNILGGRNSNEPIAAQSQSRRMESRLGAAYTTAFQFFRFNADGTLAGRLIARQQIEVSHDGESYTATSTSQVLDVNGNVIATNCATGIGTRFQ